MNTANVNGGPTRAGPGIIRPPAKITFHKLGPEVYSWDDSTWEADPAHRVSVTYSYWGSISGLTNAVLSNSTGLTAGATNPLTLHFRLNTARSSENFTWRLPIPVGGRVSLQTSTNLADWVELTTVTNRGVVAEWVHSRSQAQGFFRVVPR
jgi:hypothetical protein